MKIDRTIQREVLECLAEFYPDYPPNGLWKKLLEVAGENEQALRANLYYLYEQQCISDKCMSHALNQKGPVFFEQFIRLTHIGQDVLQADGGISAIKNTVIIRFHADAISTIEKLILNSEIDPKNKSSLVTKLRQLPFSAIEHLMKKLLDAAVLHSPEALQLIEKALL